MIPSKKKKVHQRVHHYTLSTTQGQGEPRPYPADYLVRYGRCPGAAHRAADWVGAEEGYLIVFDRIPEVSWEEKVLVRQEQYGEHRIGVWGM